MARKGKIPFSKALKKLSPKKRVEAAKSESGPMLLNMLTPTQLAELFPKYYQRGLPDTSGFRAAISQATQQQQDRYEQAVADKLGIDRQTGRTKGGWMEKMGEKYGGGGGGGGGVTKSSGSLAANQREAYQAALAEGLSPSAAKLLVANLSGENLRNPNGIPYGDPSSAHPDQKAHGMAAWDNPRSARIAKEFGAEPQNLPIKIQMKALVQEMKRDYPKAWEALNNENLPEKERMYGVVHHFERPKDDASAVSQRLSILRGMNVESDMKEGKPSEGETGATGGNMVGKSFVNSKGKTECVTYAQQGGGVGHTSGWSPGKSASTGNLKPGDWIATFGSGGRYTNTYGESHVARFENYIYDDSGKVVGMNVTHQYNKSGQVIPGKFMFGSGGEFDASRYHQIVDNGNPASMATSDGTDQKIAERKKHASEHPEQDDSNQTTNPETKAQIEARQQETTVNPPPHPAASSPQQQLADQTNRTATVEKPSGPQSFDLSRQGLINAIKKTDEYKKQTANVPDFLITDDAVVGGFFKDPATIKIMQKTGTTYDPATGRVTSEKPDELKKYFGVDTKGVLNPVDRRASVEPQTQTATVGQKLQREFGIASAQASQNNNDAFAREEEYRKKHPYGPEMPTAAVTEPITKPLGHISAKYEGAKGGVETISSGVNDPGGVSYGRHQLSSKKGTMKDFLNSPDGAAYKDAFKGLRPGSKAFDNVYTRIASNDPKEFAKAQETFINRTHYDPFIKHAEMRGLNVKDPALREAIYSMGVQHRNHSFKYIDRAAAASSGRDTAAQINALFHERMEVVPEQSKRYRNEMKDVLAYNQEQQSTTTQVAAAQQTTAPGAVPEQPKSFTEKVQTAASEVTGVKPAAAETKPVTPIQQAPQPEFPKTPKTGEVPTPPQRPLEISPVRQAQELGKPDESSQQNFLKSQGVGVPTKADGGQVTTKGQVSAFPIGGLRGDNTLAVDTKTQQPLFTFNPQTEVVVPNGQDNRATVVPTNKINGDVRGSTNDTTNQMNDVIQKMNTMMENVGQPTKKPPNEERQTPPNSMPDFVGNLLQRNTVPFHNPTMHRAMMRSVAQTETDELHGHFGAGTNNMK